MKTICKLLALSLVNSVFATSDSLIKMLEPYAEVRAPYEFKQDPAVVFDLTVASSTLGGTVNSVHWHPGGKWLAAGGVKPAANTAQVQIFAFSATGTALYARKTGNIIHGATVNEVRWSPDGNYLAVGGLISSSVNVRVIKFNSDPYDSNFGTTSKLDGCDINYGSEVRSLDWSPDGKYLVVAGKGVSNADHIKTYSFDGRALYELTDAKVTYTFTLGQVNEVRWSPDGNYIGFGGNPGGAAAITSQIYAFDRNGLNFRYLRGCDVSHTRTVHSVCWRTSDGSDAPDFVAAGERDAGNIVYRRYSFDGKLLVQIATFASNPTYVLSIDANQRYVAIGRTTGGVDDTQIEQYDFYTHGNDVNTVSLSNDATFFALGGAASGGVTVRALQLTEARDDALKKQKTEVIYLNKLLATMSADLPTVADLAVSTSFALDQVISFSLTSITTVTQKLGPLNQNTQGGGPGGGFNGRQGGIDWHPSGEYLAFSFSYGFSLAQTQVFKLDGDTLQLIDDVSTGFNAGGPTRWSSDGKFLMINGGRWNGSYVTAAQNSPKIYNFDEVQLRQVDNLTRGAAWDAYWFPSGGYIASCESSVFVDQFDGTSLTAYTNSAATASNFQQIAKPSPNGRYVAYGGEDETDIGNFMIYEFDPLAVSLTGLVNTRWFPPVAAGWEGDGVWHPSGGYIALYHTTFTSAGDYIFLLSFDGSSVTEVTTARQTFVSGQGVGVLRWDPTGRYLAGGGSGKIIIYEFDGSSELKQIFQQATVEGEAVYQMAWSPDGRYLATQTLTKLVLYKLNFSRLDDNEPTLLVDTSSAADGLLVATSYGVKALSDLAVANSYGMVNLRPFVLGTSSSLVTYVPLIRNTSNAISGLLVRTSQAANSLLVADSQAIVSINNLAVANSTTLVNMFPITIGTSNAMSNYAPLIVNTSNALNGLLVATSNAAAGLLVATSNAASGLLAVTSNAVATLVIGNSNAIVGANLIGITTIDHGPANIHMSSATMTLSYDVYLSTVHTLNIHTSGVLDGNGHTISFPNFSSVMTIDPGVTVTFQNVVLREYTDFNISLGTGASTIFGQGCTIELRPFTALSRTWTFAGSARLKGLNSQLNMNTNYIVVAPGSTLKIESLGLYNVPQSNLICLDNTARIQFQNVGLNINADFTFTMGSFRVSKDFAIRGNSIFGYGTAMGSTIDSASKMAIDQGMTFSYAPSSNFRNLLVMTDSTSVLSCNNATLVSTATGVQLKTGTLLVDGLMAIQSSAASNAEAVIFGDSTPANDLLIRLLPGAGVQLTAGYLNYQNVN